MRMTSRRSARRLNREKPSVSAIKSGSTPRSRVEARLNMAEIELVILSGQCLDRRIGEEKAIRQEIAAWEEERNTQQVQVNWLFMTQDARLNSSVSLLFRSQHIQESEQQSKARKR